MPNKGIECNLRIVNQPSKKSNIFSPPKRPVNIPNTLISTALLSAICLYAPTAFSAISKDMFLKDVIPREVLVSPGKIVGKANTGKVSWFGHYGYGKFRNDRKNKHVWRDSGDNGLTASGIHGAVPGIALLSKKTLGHWFEVELNGKTYRVRQTDYGPARWTGRKIDVNAALADLAGYSPRNFPTDSVVKWRYLGKVPYDLEDMPNNMTAEVKTPQHPQMAYNDPGSVGTLGDRALTAPVRRMTAKEIEHMEAEIPPTQPVPPPKTLADLPPKITGRIPYGMHPVILASMTEASKLLPAGHKVRFNNAKRTYSTVGDYSYHLKEDQYGALAVDIEIIDGKGRVLRNIRSPSTFGIYRDFMHWTKAIQHQRFPAYRGKGRWGGYFTSGVSQDLMHYDLGPEGGTQAGTWERGLRREYRHFGLAHDVGRGMGNIAKFMLPFPAGVVGLGPMPGKPIITEAVAMTKRGNKRYAKRWGRRVIDDSDDE